jgi:hypothetical protein
LNILSFTCSALHLRLSIFVVSIVFPFPTVIFSQNTMTLDRNWSLLQQRHKAPPSLTQIISENSESCDTKLNATAATSYIIIAITMSFLYSDKLEALGFMMTFLSVTCTIEGLGVTYVFSITMTTLGMKLQSILTNVSRVAAFALAPR